MASKDSRRRLLPALLALICLLAALPAGSQALDLAHALSGLEVLSAGAREQVFLLPAELEPENWYYATSRLHFLQKEVSGTRVPEMTLIRYQRRDPKNPNRFVEGATLQLAVDVDPLDQAAKVNLLGQAKEAADRWENEFYTGFTARLKEEAGRASASQERWKALHRDFEAAHRAGWNPRDSRRWDDLIEQALADGLDGWAVRGLEEAVRLLRMREPASLSALPMATAQLSFYDASGRIVHTAGPTRGAAPEYATESLAYTIEMQRDAADISEALLTSQTGLFLVLRREYETLSEPLPCRVEIDYDRALTEYRRDLDFAIQALLFAAFKLPEEAEKEKADLCRRLESRGLLLALEPDGAPRALASLDTRMLQALLGRINRALLEEQRAASEVDLKALGSAPGLKALPEKTLATPTLRKSVSTSQRKEERIDTGAGSLPAGAPARSGSETLAPGYRYRDRRSAVSPGFLSLAGCGQGVRDRLIIDEKTPEWENAYFLLPGVGDDPQLGIFQVNARIALHIKGQSWQEQTATWRIGKGWALEGGRGPAQWGLLSFALPEARRKYGEKELLKSEFRIEQEIFCDLGKNFRLKAQYAVEVFDGRSMIASPLECVQPVIFDFSNFAWRAPDLAVYQVSVRLNQRVGRSPVVRVERNTVPGRELLGLPLVKDPMQEPDVGTISAQVLFAAREKKRIVALKWTLNDENLVELYPALFVSIMTEDRTK